MANLSDRLIAYHTGEMADEDIIQLFQELIDNGQAWKLEGSIGRTAMALIEAGKCMLGTEGHRDFYGNYVPSRSEVEPGTKGSAEYVEARRSD